MPEGVENIMYIFLIIWLIFLFIYIAFNAYGLYRVVAMRIKGDKVGVVVLVYLIVMFLIIFTSLFIISRLDWGKSLTDFVKF